MIPMPPTITIAGTDIPGIVTFLAIVFVMIVITFSIIDAIVDSPVDIETYARECQWFEQLKTAQTNDGRVTLSHPEEETNLRINVELTAQMRQIFIISGPGGDTETIHHNLRVSDLQVAKLPEKLDTKITIPIQIRGAVTEKDISNMHLANYMVKWGIVDPAKVRVQSAGAEIRTRVHHVEHNKHSDWQPYMLTSPTN